MPGPGSCAVPKPEPLKRTRARKKRKAAVVVKTVRAVCVERDGFCRAVSPWLGKCEGASEWAHLHSHMRSKTRGRPATQRHTAPGSVMLCTEHHQQYDARQLEISLLTEFGADGTLRFTLNGVSVLSVPRHAA